MSGNRVNQAVPSFINGVSQQPPTVRLATQCELLENGLPTVSDGLRKRPPLRHLAKLWPGRMDDAYTHAINRDEIEQYMVFISGGDLKVIDLLDNGREIPVAFPDGKAYLKAALPRDSFSSVTVADYTFIVNKNVTVALLDEVTPDPTPEALVYVKHNYSSTTYKVIVDGQEATHTTAGSDTQPNSQKIAAALKTQLERSGGLTVDITGSVLRISKTDGSDFTFSVTDSWGEQALVGIKKQVAKFTDLPAKAFDGFKVKVTGESKGEDDDYYVCYDSEGGTRNGTWDECRGWGVQSDFDHATMPHVLIRTEDGTFVFKQANGAEPYEVASWESAKVGDDSSCPPPSFIGKTISGMVFFRNRLGILAGENVVLSRDAEFFNFWPKTTSTAVATDPIDYASSHEKVSILRFAVPFQDSLALFADQVQFQLGNGGASAFSPETVRLDISTQFDCSPKCAPVAAGQNIYFVVENKDNSAVMEYFVTTDGVTLDATEVTAHVPRYIPHGVFKMIASTNDDYLMLLSTAQRNVVWLYKYFWIDEDKVQSAWGKWIFPETDTILSIAGIGPDVYFAIQRDDGVYLEHCNMQSIRPDDGLDFQVHLDRRVTVRGVYDEARDRTTWTLPYSTDGMNLSVVLGGGFPGRGGRELKPVVAGNRAECEGRYDAADCYCGLPYVFRIRISEQFVRESKDIGAPVIAEGRIQLLNFVVLHRDSGYFRSEVTAKGRETITKPHLGTIGDGGFRIGKSVIDSIPHRFTVLARSSQVSIDIVNDRHFPSNLLSAEWTGLYSLDSQRV
ncbi:MAG: hypothetical protein LUG50_06810 [Planctomycetaceae bacterium]|nr:hypothetical protein [Planctomycetaceae bacterium]